MLDECMAKLKDEENSSIDRLRYLERNIEELRELNRRNEGKVRELKVPCYKAKVAMIRDAVEFEFKKKNNPESLAMEYLRKAKELQ